MPFQAIKMRSSKSRKIEIFPKGLALVHGFGPKLAIFPSFVLGNIGQENVIYDILKGKTPFQAIKTRSSKSRKFKIFSKGQFMVWRENWPFFHLFFRQYRPGKFVLLFSSIKKRLFRLQKREVQKVEKLRFFQRGQSRVLVPNQPFFHVFILVSIGQEYVFYNILEGEKSLSRL